MQTNLILNKYCSFKNQFISLAFILVYFVFILCLHDANNDVYKAASIYSIYASIYVRIFKYMYTYKAICVRAYI
jgi:hypothetical protein